MRASKHAHEQSKSRMRVETERAIEMVARYESSATVLCLMHAFLPRDQHSVTCMIRKIGFLPCESTISDGRDWQAQCLSAVGKDNYDGDSMDIDGHVAAAAGRSRTN